MDSDPPLREVNSDSFNAETYVKNICQSGEGASQLFDSRKQFQNLADETSLLLKKNVYKNYAQFIETAKEISHLESEMYQLSHMLTEQKGMLNSLIDMCVTDEKVEKSVLADMAAQKEEATSKRGIADLLQMVEGCGSVADVPNRYLIHDGNLVELDPDDFRQLQRTRLFLLNDCLVIASHLATRKGPIKYKFYKLYELSTLAVVNVRDIGPVKNAFKILMFPDAHLFQADNSKSKKEWMDIFEQTKRTRLERAQSRIERSMESPPSTAASQLDSARHAKRASSVGASHHETESSRNFGESGDVNDVTSSSAMEAEILQADWLQELPEDLDVCIAQRDFEGAVDLLEKTWSHIKDCPKGPLYKELEVKMDKRVKSLTGVLVHELCVSSDRTLQGGPRSARRAVALLIRLGKSSQACSVFLANRSGLVRHSLRQLKIEGTTSLYVRRLSAIFFNSIIDAAVEFQKAFVQNQGCYSAFTVFARQELQEYYTYFSRQVFDSKPPLSVAAECVAIARNNCSQMVDSGIDLTFALDGLLEEPVRKQLQESKDKLVDTNRVRAVEDHWTVYELKSKSAMDQLLTDLLELGLANVDAYVSGTTLSLTSNTVQFTRLYVRFVEDCLRLYTPSLHKLVSDCLQAAFKSQLLHYDTSLRHPDYSRKHDFILKNAEYLLETLLALMEHRVEQRMGAEASKQLGRLQRELARMRGIVKNTQITSISVSG